MTRSILNRRQKTAPRAFALSADSRCWLATLWPDSTSATTLRLGRYELQFFAKPGSENRINNYGESMGQVLEFYTKEYGAPLFGTRLIMAQIDDETMETYSRVRE